MKSLPVESKRDDVQILGTWIDFGESDWIRGVWLTRGKHSDSEDSTDSGKGTV